MAEENAQAGDAAAKNMIKSIVLTGHGGYDKLKVQESPRPKPGDGEVLINIKASGINFVELMCRQGMYDHCPKVPTVLGIEGSGVIVEIGEGVDNFTTGDRVICMKDFGLWSEYAVAPASTIYLMPDNMTFEEGASLLITYCTAHLILFNFGNLRPHQSVLVHMAAGGVGTAATQLCSTVEDVTVFGTASAAKHERIKENGVTHPIDYRTTDYVAEVKKVSATGVDIVMDPLSGEDSNKGYNLLKPLGKIVHYGTANFVSGPTKNYFQVLKTWWGTKSFNPSNLINQNKAVCGVELSHLWNKAEVIRPIVQEILDLYSQGKIKPLVDTTWAFEDVDLAMSRMHERQNVGKVVLSTEKAPEVRPEPEKKKEKKRRESKKKQDKKVDAEKADKDAKGAEGGAGDAPQETNETKEEEAAEEKATEEQSAEEKPAEEEPKKEEEKKEGEE